MSQRSNLRFAAGSCLTSTNFFSRSNKITGLTVTYTYLKISKIFTLSVPFGKFSSTLHRTPNYAQGGQFCT